LRPGVLALSTTGWLRNCLANDMVAALDTPESRNLYSAQLMIEAMVTAIESMLISGLIQDASSERRSSRPVEEERLIG
jgi:hypothetical protein